MSSGRIDTVLRQLRHYLAAERAGGTADADLLRRFADAHDEGAFAALVQRYGPLVLGVCRRVLSHEQDAEDAFQATFLILVRRAGALHNGGSLASWLYTVAYHAALKARAAAARRRAQPAPLDDLPAPAAPDDLDRRELRAVLDEELQGLPAKYREPLLLCDLQGKTHAEVARVLGRPSGSMSRLLERARSLLRDRLVRRGVALSTGLLATLLVENARAVTPPALAHITVHAAAAAAGTVPSQVLALVEGVLRQMFVTRLKIAAALLLTLGLIGAGAGLLTAYAGPKDPSPGPRAEERAGEAPGEATDKRPEAPLPDGALARLGTSHFHHANVVRGLAFSPDGKVIASGSNKGTIRLWDAETGLETRLLAAHNGQVAALAFAPDGKTLASGGWDRKIHLWEVATGNLIRTLEGHEGGVHAVAFAPDGKTLLTASSDTSARLWEAATGKELRRLEGHDKEVCSAVFSADGKFVATGSVDNTARVWDAASAKELHKFEGHASRVRGVAFSPDGKRLLTGGWDTTARLWNVDSGKQLTQMQHTSGIEAVAFAPDGKSVATASGWDDLVQLWDVTGNSGRVRWHGKAGQPFALVFSRDGKKLAAAGWDGTVHVWDAAGGKEHEAGPTAGHASWVCAVAFLPDRKTLVSAANDGQVILWDVARGRERSRLAGSAKRVWCLAVAPDGKTVATGCGDQTVVLWDVAGATVLRTIKADGSVKGLAFSPDGRHLAAVSGPGPDDNSTKPVTGTGAGVWEVSTGNSLFHLEGHEGGVKSVAYSPDGKTIATGGVDKTVRLWDATSGKELAKLEGHGAPVDAVAFAPDGKLLASAGQGGFTRVWRLGTNELHVQFGTNNNVPAAVAFSADGRTLAVATRNLSGQGQVRSAVRLWDVTTGKERARFAGHQETAAAVAFSADGRVLASGGGDGTVFLWDVTGRAENGRAAADLPPPVLESEWTDLTLDDGFKMHKAVWALAAAPKQALPLLRDTLKPVPAGEPKRIEQLVKKLDDDDFEVREKASAELEKVGEPAGPALRKALDGAPSAEMRSRIKRLLENFSGKVASPDQLRRERALEVLEHIGTAEARAILEDIAKGAPEAALTQEAKAALKRLGK